MVWHFTDTGIWEGNYGRFEKIPVVLGFSYSLRSFFKKSFGALSMRPGYA